MDSKPQYSGRQKVLLQAASEAPVDHLRVVKALIELIHEDPSGDLHPDWRKLWDEARKNIDQSFPQAAISKIDAAMKKVFDLSQLFHLPENRSTSSNPSGILSRDDKVCFLIGSGASKPSDIPTVAELLEDLLDRGLQLDQPAMGTLYKWCKKNKVVNIERLLTAAYMAEHVARNPKATGLIDFFLFQFGQIDPDATSDENGQFPEMRTASPGSLARLQDTLRILFGLIAAKMIKAKPHEGHKYFVKWICEQVTAKRNVSIVTTNYDCCIEEALQEYKTDQGQFGFRFAVGAGSPRSDEKRIFVNTYAEAEEGNGNAIGLMKIHGSINWAYCDSCHDVREFRVRVLKLLLKHDKVSFPIVGSCPKCKGQRHLLLIPPLGVKYIIYPNLIRLWHEAREALRNADMIVVVGYSFADADAYVRKIVERSMSQKKDQRLLICDWSDSVAKLMRERLKHRIEDFDENRIIYATGSADVLLPKVLDRLSGKERE